MKLLIMMFALVAALLTFQSASAEDYEQGTLSFYGAVLSDKTVQVTAFEQGHREIYISGHITMSKQNWRKFSQGLAAAGFPVSVGEPKPISTGGVRNP